MDDPLFDRWMTALEARHLAELTFPEVSRALRALSSAYVERRARLGQGAALSGAGKRAAFALFYGPLHYLILRHIASAIAARGESLASHRDGRGAPRARRDDRVAARRPADRQRWSVSSLMRQKSTLAASLSTTER